MTYKKTIIPLLSIFIFTLGNGLFTTLVSMKLHINGASSFIIGLITSVYYIGIMCGSFRTERFIIMVGHIRAFATFASFLTIITLLQGVFHQNLLWLIFRFLVGIATAGVFVVVESWLLTLGTQKVRGQLLALYMVALYLGQSLGQLLINTTDINTILPFILISILSSFAVIILAMSKITQPSIEEPSVLGFVKLYRASASGMIGSFGSGMILGSVYGLFPVFLLQYLSYKHNVGFCMFIIIFGGMVLQYPIGRLSDIVERRVVLCAINMSLVVLAALLIFGNFYGFYILIALMFLFGGAAFTIYPVSINLTCDNLATQDIVSGVQGLLLAFSVGSALGPFIASFFIEMPGNFGLLLYFIIIGTLLTGYFLYRRSKKEAVEQEGNFVAIPQTSPITAELQPQPTEPPKTS